MKVANKQKIQIWKSSGWHKINQNKQALHHETFLFWVWPTLSRSQLVDFTDEFMKSDQDTAVNTLELQ